MDLRELYQEVILDHNRNPRNCRRIEQPTCSAQGHNPLCGDRITVYLDLDDDGRVRDLSFEGAGCAICMASASMMTESLKGRPRQEAERLFQRFHKLVTGVEDVSDAADGNDDPPLGKLEVFAGVREFPVRVKCASLPWHTLQAAIRDRHETVTTE